MSRKYGTATDAIRESAKVILVIDLENRPDWPQVKAALAKALHPGLALEIWEERQLIGWLKERTGVEIRAIDHANLLDIRQAIDRAKGFYAFGGSSLAEYEHDPLKSELLWHFGFWQLRQVREARGLTAAEIFPPGHYRGVAVLLADLCGFSSYVRDTADGEIIRDSLTAFYSKARYQVINSGGMLLQFVGDQVVAVFGVLNAGGECVRDALRAARALVHIGGAVSHHWQRHIDRLQPAAGLHIGMALGDLQTVSLRPYSRTHMGAIGDCINVAARLMALAGPSEIVVSNSLFQRIEDSSQRNFVEVAPVEAKNVGRIKAWKETLKQETSEPSA
jgi:class 3 adenylate cyclase